MQNCHKKNPVSKLAICSLTLFFISVIPLLVLGKYNVMGVDDYCYGIQVHDTWLQTHSIWQSLKSALEHTRIFYLEWQGTYVSCFLMSMCPMNFIYELAFCVPIIMIGMFSLSTYLLGRQIFRRWFDGDRNATTYVMGMILFLFFQIMDAPYEGIYWYNGATHYVLMESFLFLLLTAVSGIIWTDSKRNMVVWCGLAAVDGIIVGGGNLVTGLQAEILLVLLVLYVFVKDRKKKIYVLIPFICFTTGFLFNILAPGNTARSDSLATGGYSAIVSIMLSFYNEFVYMIKWTTFMVVLVWIAALPAMWQIGKKSSKKFKYPVLVTLGFLCILAAMFTPTLYALGEAGIARVNNIIQMVYYLGIFAITTYWFGWFAHNKESIQENGKLGFLRRGLEQHGNTVMVLLFLLVVAVWVFTPDKNTYTGISALRSLMIGDARTFYTEEMERYDMYLDDALSDVVVETHSVCPYLFNIRDVSWDVNNWINQAMTHYYHKNSIYRLVEVDS